MYGVANKDSDLEFDPLTNGKPVEFPGSSPEWVPIYYDARSTARTGLTREPSSLWGSTLGTSPVKHQNSDRCESNRQLQL